jgi:hypothetical protein
MVAKLKNQGAVPILWDCEEWLKGVNWIRIGKISGKFGFLEENSEKGCSRKSTEKWVAR